MHIISVAQARKANVSAESLHAVADWNFEQAELERKPPDNKRAERHAIQGSVLRKVAMALEKA